MGLSRQETYRILRQLDGFGLIKWDKNDAITLPDKVPFLFDRSVKCAVEFARKQAHRLVDTALSGSPPKPAHCSMRYLAMTKEELGEFYSQLNKLILEQHRKHSFPGRGKAKARGLVPLQALFCVIPGEPDYFLT